LLDFVRSTGRKFVNAAILGSALMACSTLAQGTLGGAAAAQNVPSSEQCSMVGRMACNAMAVISSDSVPTCSAFRARDGTRVETCGTVPISVKTAPSGPVDPKAYPVQLAWSDNSDNESNFVIERCDQVSIAATNQKNATCAGAWRQIATVGANTTNYVDNSASVNQTYMYRVKAINSKGSSAYTGQALITTPPR
jgi:hypothetical protein